ncbi:COX15/CtaA family protein [Deminuibacter soli]|uniref:Heme A synthase n=1 Tax=Deminuibacter soli TaxID=2291815 RepID=A0A3E1NRA4_9BACT|nr:COX15/CtaA family protein [Deminuibacter soli]RFM30427.1 heme A synthase [Deminuibacter soli]
MNRADKNYLHFTQFVLFSVFLVIVAGSVVRMTQSGMGCPDWPRCFGRWIPPVNASQLPPDYEKYLKKQDIDHTFNVFHTWTEYINRLTGALLGLWLVIHVGWSFKKYFRTRPSLFWISSLLLVMVAFEAWLGKLVVDANLAVVKITAHMLAALVIAAVTIVIIQRVNKKTPVQDKELKWLANIALLCLLVQVILGTEVREQIDEISKSLNYIQRDSWISRLNVFFTLHKSFAWVAALACVVVFWKSLSYPTVSKTGAWIFVTVLASMGLGLAMTYFHMPALAQPLHLLCATILFMLVFALRLRLK